jgi:hypothetical protein
MLTETLPASATECFIVCLTSSRVHFIEKQEVLTFRYASEAGSAKPKMED